MIREMKYGIVAVTLVLLLVNGGGAVPVEQWNKTFGGTGDDTASSVQQTSDGGYIFVGYTDWYWPDVRWPDALLVKTDINGNILWNESFGGTGVDRAYSVQQTSDGGYILAGMTSSYGAGSGDAWLIKTDSNGNHQWNKTFGGINGDEARSVLQTSDGGYIMAGETSSYGAGSWDAWLIKTDSNGNEQWNKTFGGTNLEYAYSIRQAYGGGYIIAGMTSSYGAGSWDAWLIKTDANGNHLWNKTFGGTSHDYAYSVSQTLDGEYILGGGTESYGAGNWDAWLIKTDANGNQLWNKTFGGINADEARTVQQTSDGIYIIGGLTNSYGAGSSDAWLIKTDSNGNQQWNKTFGGTNGDGASSVQQTLDGGYILAGSTNSYGAGSYDDVWLIKVSSEKNRRIAFQSMRDGNEEIYLMNEDGSGQTRLTQNTANDGYPAWSPDGQKIAFSSNRTGNWEVFVMNANGSSQTNLTRNPASDGYPAWSPDGKTILFASDRDSLIPNRMNIYTMNTDGTNEVRLTSNAAEDVHPAWSPYGQKIAFASDREGNREIYIMNRDGSGIINLTKNGMAYDDYPAWSPVGNKIAFASDRDSHDSTKLDIYIMNADGSNVIRLTNNAADDRHPSWSPDGNKIAFASDRDGNREIYVMNADGTGATRLTNQAGDDQHPAFIGIFVTVCSSGCDYTRIQDAINASSAGDTILVYSGTYYENVNVNKQLILKGIDTGGGKPIMNAGLKGNVVTITADRVTLEGFVAINGKTYDWGNSNGIKVLSNNNTIRNNNVSNNNVGIYIYSSNNNTLSGNNVNLNHDYGIYMGVTNSNILTNNTVSNNNIGISLGASNNNTLRSNKMLDNQYNFGVGESDVDDYYNNNIDTSNTVNGKPIYYLQNVSDKVYNASINAGIFYCINCNNITVRDLTLINNMYGIVFYKTNNSKIENMNVSNNDGGIFLLSSSNNMMSNNNVSGILLPLFI